jgi:hypothetical protein
MAGRRLKAVETPEETIARLEARVARLKSKRTTLRTLPSEPHQIENLASPVVWFVKFWGNETPYQYVASHVHGKGWIVSHQSKRTYLTWNEVLDFALLCESDGYAPTFYVATAWVALSAR